jgi:hypothetical protein
LRDTAGLRGSLRLGSHLGSQSLTIVDARGGPKQVSDLLKHARRSELKCQSQISKAREGSRPPWVQIPPLPPSTSPNAGHLYPWRSGVWLHFWLHLLVKRPVQARPWGRHRHLEWVVRWASTGVHRRYWRPATPRSARQPPRCRTGSSASSTSSGADHPIQRDPIEERHERREERRIVFHIRPSRPHHLKHLFDRPLTDPLPGAPCCVQRGGSYCSATTMRWLLLLSRKKNNSGTPPSPPISSASTSTSLFFNSV